MNRNITEPLIIQFTPPEAMPNLKKSSKSLFVPVNATWEQFKTQVLPLVSSDEYDSVLVHARDDVDRDMKGVVGNMTIKLNALASAGTKVNKPVLSYETPDKPFYLANPSFDDMKAAGKYAPSDETIMAKYNSYESDAAWQAHQSDIWDRMKEMMPLSKKADQYNRNHAAQLRDPKRGLEEKDLDKFWSFKAKKGLAPTIIGDDMVGMPSVEGRDYEGFTMAVNQSDGSVAVKPLQVRSLMTVGPNGIAIPMANADGKVNKHQIATDLTPYGTVLHFRAADGKTVAKGELFNKNNREYAFKFTDGKDTHLKTTEVAADDTITMQDIHGTFKIKPKKEIIDVLRERGYEIPAIITSVKAEQNGKYMWQAPGTMTGSESVKDKVSPSNPGFIIARKPKNGEEKYVVLVAEGALKGHIVAKYVDVKDSQGNCFGDTIAGDKGIIVTQVPGVAESYVKNAVTIYDKYNVAGTYIAMDADGRENRNVAKGIHGAYNYINKFNPTTVLSWDPEQKGMDDALLAVAQSKITIEDMKLISGKPEALFPIEKAHAMLPYKLDGSQASQPAWIEEYEEDKKIREEKVAEAQAQTAARQAEQWVETPQDIINIQSVTIAKSADIADAMSGKVPINKAESRIPVTPDIDEEAIEKAEKEQKSDILSEEREMAEKWNEQNPAMPPLEVKEGYKASYLYQQPIVHNGTIPELPTDTQYVNGNLDRWGLINISTDHEMSGGEKKERREFLANNGVECIGSMRLMNQTFSLDQGESVNLSAEDLPIDKEGGQKL